MNNIKNEIKFMVIILIISTLATPIHELGHGLGCILDGIKVTRVTFNGISTVNSESSMLGVSGGPIISLALALFGLLIFYSKNKNKDIWAGFSFIMCLTRLIAYGIALVSGSFFINDEGLMAVLLHLPVWSIYIVFLSVFIVIILLIIKYLRIYHMNYLKILGYSLMCFSLVMYIEVEILNKVLFH